MCVCVCSENGCTMACNRHFQESPAENVISWDMKRTFVNHTHFKEKDAKEILQKICKAYSVYDPEVGYCGGFSFIVAVLLLQVLYVVFVCMCEGVECEGV